MSLASRNKNKKDKASIEPPRWSSRIYVQLARRDIAFFKFILESYDHLAYLTVVDKHRAVVKVVFAPGAETEVRDLLVGLSRELSLTLLPV